MHADVITALDTDAPTIFYCLEISTDPDTSPVTTLRYLDGSGSVTFDSMTFVGEDSTYGSIDIPSGFNDGMDGVSPTLRFNFHPRTEAAALSFMDLMDESTTVRVWGPGAVNIATGASLGSPDLIFAGYVERATDVLGRGLRIVEVEVVGGIARLLDRGEGLTMNDASHQSIRSGELGFEYVTGLNKKVYWGQANPSNGAIGATHGALGLFTGAVRQLAGLS